MRTEGFGKFYSILSGGGRYDVDQVEVASDEGCEVKTFSGLQNKVAEISYKNPALNLYYRGQKKDYKDCNKRLTSLFPSLYRQSENIAICKKLCQDYFDIVITKLSKRILEKLKEEGFFKKSQGRNEYQDARRFPEIAWAILQHYEICPTPLLDVTQSLYVAANFATVPWNQIKNDDKSAYIYVLGLPNINGHISYFTHKCLVMLKLDAVCPPDAKRPHYQQGYVIGSLPHVAIHPNNLHVRDFRHRLVAKFRIRNVNKFWKDKGYSPLEKEVLMPRKDKVKICLEDYKEEYRREHKKLLRSCCCR